MKLFSVNSHNTRSSNSLEIFKVLFHTIFTQSHLKITHNTQKKKKKKFKANCFLSILRLSSSPKAVVTLWTQAVFSNIPFFHKLITANGTVSRKIQIKLFFVNFISFLLHILLYLSRDIHGFVLFHFLRFASQTHPLNTTNDQVHRIKIFIKNSNQIKFFSINSTTFFVCTLLYLPGDFQGFVLHHLLTTPHNTQPMPKYGEFKKNHQFENSLKIQIKVFCKFHWIPRPHMPL